MASCTDIVAAIYVCMLVLKWAQISFQIKGTIWEIGNEAENAFIFCPRSKHKLFRDHV